MAHLHDMGAENQLQPPRSPAPLPAAEREPVPLSMEFTGPRGPKLSAGILFGAFVGLLTGALVAVACCWLTGLSDFWWEGILIGSVAGSMGGSLIGLKERKKRGDLTRPDIATLIGVVYGLVPALLILFGGAEVVTGKFSGLVFMGAVGAGPMLGLLIGAFLDRAFEAFLRKTWGPSVGFGAAGVAICMALLIVFVTAPYGPDPQAVAQRAQGLILREWKKTPQLRGATIQAVRLVRTRNLTYTGFVDATLDGRPERLRLEVRFEGEVLFWKLSPDDD